MLARASRISRSNPSLLNTYGGVLHALGRHQEAIKILRRALSVKADAASLHTNLASSYAALGDTEAALTSYRRALALDPHNADTHTNLGALLLGRGEIETAIALHRRALELNPGHSVAHFNFGSAVRALGCYDEAIEHYGHAIDARRGFADAYFNRAAVRLLRGKLGDGWRDYEWRVEAQTGKPYIADPRAPGKMLPKPSTLVPLELRGKRLLILRDQGLGDEIFFLRFAAKLKLRGASLAAAPNPKLAGMLGRTGVFDAVLQTGDAAPDFDQVVLAGDLPLLAGCETTGDIPPPLRLRPLDDAVRALRARLTAAGAGPWLGLSWRAGDPAPAVRLLTLVKEIALAELAAGVAVWPGSIAILQRAPRNGEIAQIRRLISRPVLDLSALNEDLEQMLALLLLLDEYAGVSNTNMHLRAGLGLNARVLVPDPPEWRWMDRGTASPWFPGFRVYRQDRGAGWGGALSELSADLCAAAMAA
jgi:Tfp pilus assembly protein PilF